MTCEWLCTKSKLRRSEMFIDAVLRAERSSVGAVCQHFAPNGARNQLHRSVYKHSVPTGLRLPKLFVQSDLKQRTKKFALRVMKLVEALPKTASGRAIGNQLVRCGTGVGSNYRACCRARSRAEFIAKIGIVEEEADESAFWMELIIEGSLPPARRLSRS